MQWEWEWAWRHDHVPSFYVNCMSICINYLHACMCDLSITYCAEIKLDFQNWLILLKKHEKSSSLQSASIWLLTSIANVHDNFLMVSKIAEIAVFKTILDGNSVWHQNKKGRHNKKNATTNKTLKRSYNIIRDLAMGGKSTKEKSSGNSPAAFQCKLCMENTTENSKLVKCKCTFCTKVILFNYFRVQSFKFIDLLFSAWLNLWWKKSTTAKLK